MKKVVIIILILIVLALFFFSIYDYLVYKNIVKDFFSEDKDKFSGKNENKSDNNKNQQNGPDSKSSDSKTKNDVNKGNVTEEKKLPDDLYTNSCGFYFKGYEVCAGKCPDGSSCITEGRSCYCKRD